MADPDHLHRSVIDRWDGGENCAAFPQKVEDSDPGPVLALVHHPSARQDSKQWGITHLPLTLFEIFFPTVWGSSQKYFSLLTHINIFSSMPDISPKSSPTGIPAPNIWPYHEQNQICQGWNQFRSFLNTRSFFLSGKNKMVMNVILYFALELSTAKDLLYAMVPHHFFQWGPSPYLLSDQSRSRPN